MLTTPLQSTAASQSAAPRPTSGPPPRAGHPAPPRCKPDAVVAPQARPPLGAPPGPRRIIDGTPEVLLAGAALGGLALVEAGVGLAGAAGALRSATTYGADLARSVVRSLADPVKAGEHIAEGLLGGAAWAGAATGVGTLAEAARARLAHETAPQPPERR
jgi:hypothetical protein